MMEDNKSIHVLVVIVAYRSGSILERCLHAVASDRAVDEVVVVDNASEDAARNIVHKLSVKDERFFYIDPGENLGFAKGCNRGVASARRAWTHVFFVNPDVQLTSPLMPLVEELEGGTAIVAGLLVSPEHPRSVNARPLVTMKRELAKALLGTRAYRATRSLLDRGSVPVEQVDGALLGMSRATFQELKGFDERFDLYYEDVDLCARAVLLGEIRLVSTPFGIHKGGASFAAASARAYRLGRVSRVRYLRKHYGARLTVTCAIAAIALVEWLARSLTSQPEGMRTRSSALRLQIHELIKPGSVHLLRSP